MTAVLSAKAASTLDRLGGLWRLGRAAAGHGPIGLEVGLQSLNMVQLRRGGDGRLALQASARVPHPADRDGLLAAPAAFARQLGQALRGRPFAGRQVVSTLPAQEVRLLPVPYEVSAGRNDAAAIGQALRDRLDGDLSGYVVDYIPLRVDNQSSERLALVAAARRPAVIAYLELLRKAGLEVAALEIGPSAIRRLVSVMSSSEAIENHLVINFGVATSYLTVVSGRRLLQDQKVEFGERDLLEQIGAALQITPAEAGVWVKRYGLHAAPADTGGAVDGDAEDVARTLVEIIKPRLLTLVDEINRVLIYTASETRGASVGSLHLLGSLAHWSGMEALLQSLVEIPVRVLNNPLSLFAPEAQSEQTCDQALAIATGLALRGMLEEG